MLERCSLYLSHPGPWCSKRRPSKPTQNDGVEYCYPDVNMSQSGEKFKSSKYKGSYHPQEITRSTHTIHHWRAQIKGYNSMSLFYFYGLDLADASRQ